MMRNWPEPSVVAVLTFSIRAGLAASTVTPGSTAPEASLTTPVMEACAHATDGNRTKAMNVKTQNELRRMARFSLFLFRLCQHTRNSSGDLTGPATVSPVTCFYQLNWVTQFWAWSVARSCSGRSHFLCDKSAALLNKT